MNQPTLAIAPRRPLYDVAIAGLGPTGAALANLLGLQGLSVLVIERGRGVLQIPRAVHLDGETMRVFQSMGLASRMLPIMRPGHGMHWVDAKGETLLVRKGLAGLGPQGWHNDYYFHQPQLEAVLREGLARCPNVEILEGTELADIEPGHDNVCLQLKPAEESSQARTAVACRYLVGCDGARSRVRTFLGDEHEDLGMHQAWLVVDGQLHHPLPLPEHSVQHCDPARPATSIYVHPLRRRWEIMLLPGEDPQQIVQPEMVWRLLAPWLKPTQAVLERAATYVFHSLVARHWQQGRVMIAGDAAHQTPPFLGQGLCAGIRDAANLAWKLGRALRAGQDATSQERAARLLASYGPERLPHAREFVQLAVDLGRVIQCTDVAEAEARDHRLKAEGLQFAFPAPTLGAGVHRADRPGAPQGVGQIFAQPLLPDGTWLDDCAAGRFSVLFDASSTNGRDVSHIVSSLDAHDFFVTGEPGADTLSWMREHGAAALVLRPDGYLFDACEGPDTLRASLEELARWT